MTAMERWKAEVRATMRREGIEVSEEELDESIARLQASGVLDADANLTDRGQFALQRAKVEARLARSDLEVTTARVLRQDTVRQRQGK